MKHTLKVIRIIIAMVMLLDVMGFMAWLVSGQIPTDNIYIGTITAHIIKIILQITP